MNNDDYDAIYSCPEPSQPLFHIPMILTPKKEGETCLRGCLPLTVS